MAEKYQEIMNNLEEAILCGRLAPGDRLPSERDLADLYHCHRSTVARALGELVDRRLIERKVGSGSFVSRGKWSLGLPDRMQRSAFPESPYSRQVKARLAADPDTPWQHLEDGDAPRSWLPQGSIRALSWDKVFDAAADGDAMGLTALRETVAKDLYARYHWQVSPEEILITSGTQQAIFLVTHGYLNPGDTVAIEAPSYFYHLPIFQAAGLRLIPIHMQSEGPSIEDLAQAVRHTRISMVFLNPIFQNPTGIHTSLKRRKEILHLCNRYQIPIFEDDASAQLSYAQETENRPIKALSGADQMFYAGSISKYMGPTIRIGWLIGPPHLMHALANFRRDIDAGLSALPQHILRDYMARDLSLQIDLLKRRTRTALKDLTAYMKANFPALHPVATQGGFYLYYRWPIKNRPQYEAVRQQLLDDHIIIAEGQAFGDDRPAMRLNLTQFRPIS
ncbi:PLP-dependent aminotransferase family protein [Peptococcus simiae]|uniref:aminotransferase-like domain-containing protein n=1 Tax=Peptococcus simiae TaxID=1643805 RepID=UPI00397F4414